MQKMLICRVRTKEKNTVSLLGATLEVSVELNTDSATEYNLKSIHHNDG
jgi:hypothetical protein